MKAILDKEFNTLDKAYRIHSDNDRVGCDSINEKQKCISLTELLKDKKDYTLFFPNEVFTVYIPIDFNNKEQYNPIHIQQIIDFGWQPFFIMNTKTELDELIMKLVNEWQIKNLNPGYYIGN